MPYTSALDLLSRLPLLAPRREALAAIAETAARDTLVLGVVGVTSTGKSALLNALMGELLLAEQARPTSNVLVRCGRGPQRAVDVTFTDGRVKRLAGRALTADSVARYASEERNPRNRLGVRVLTWTSPDALFPEGLVVVDTPGLDAHGHDDHEELTMRQFLPKADIVVYLVDLRKGLKTADLAALGAMVENDQRVLFVLSKIDLELDSFQGGKLHKSREEKIARHMERLQRDVAEHTRIEAFDVVGVSARLAVQGLGNRRTEGWQCSGFDGFVAHLEGFTTDLRAYTARTGRAVAQIELALQDLNGALSVKAEAARPTPRLLALRDVEARAGALASTAKALEKAWSDLRGTAEVEHLRAPDEQAARALCVARREALAASQASFCSLLDAQQAGLRAWVDSVQVAPERRGGVAFAVDEAPDTLAHRRNEWKKVQVRGWFDSWAFWPESAWRTYVVFDEEAYARALASWIQGACDAARGHVRWWSAYCEAAYLVPARRALRTEEAAFVALTAERAAGATNRAEMERVRNALTEEASRLRQANADASRRSSPSPEPTGAGLRSCRVAVPPWLAEQERAFPAQLHAFLATRGAGSPGDGADARVLLLGAHREGRVRLAALVAGDLALAEVIDAVPTDRWTLVEGREVRSFLRPPTTARGIVIAPLDRHLRGVSWPVLLGRYDMVGVEVDTPRPGAGRADLARAPYARHLRPDRDFLLSGDGALYAGRLGDLLTEVLPSFADAGCLRLPWLFFEDWDLRYTHLVELATAVSARGGTSRELLRRWSQAGFSLEAPFTPDALEQAFDAVTIAARVRSRVPGTSTPGIHSEPS